MDNKHSPDCECCGGTAKENDARQAKQEQQTDELQDFMHHPPTDRETLSDPEALDDLVDLRHLE